eukprot:m.268593 g.268593  ORF g.268593 m.268593 type:complete len:559 (-) comp17654_c0_seq2:12167-13843(-)
MAASSGAALSLMSSDTLIQRLRVTELKNVIRALGGRISGPRMQLCDRIRGYLMQGGDLATSCRELLEKEYKQLKGTSPSRPPLGLAVSFRATEATSEVALKLIPWPFFVNVVQVLKPHRMTSGTPGSWNFAYTFRLQLSSYQVQLLDITTANPPYRAFLRCGHKRKNASLLYDQFPRNGTWTINNQPSREKLSLRCRPYDITEHLRPSVYGPINTSIAIEAKRTTQQAQTFDTSVVEIVIAQERSVEDLYASIGTKDMASGIAFVKSKLKQDPNADIISAAEENVMLNCCFTYTRMKHPARGEGCKHIQCFDAINFLKMNKRKPDWECPICMRPTPLNEIRLDAWTQDVLKQAPASSNKVTVRDDATWTYLPSSTASTPPGSPRATAATTTTATALPTASTTGQSAAFDSFDPEAFDMDGFSDSDLAELAAMIDQTPGASVRLQHSLADGTTLPNHEPAPAPASQRVVTAPTSTLTAPNVHSQMTQAVQASLHAASQLTNAASAMQSSLRYPADATGQPLTQRPHMMEPPTSEATSSGSMVDPLFGTAGSRHDPILLD